MLAVLALALGATGSCAAAASCPIRQDTAIVYSKSSGVGGASIIWVEDLLWWLQQHDPTAKYQGLVEAEIQACDLASFKNLRLYVNPGGNAYNQLSALQANGTANIKAFVQRTSSPAAYAGFCAGAYMAAHDYVWETMYEGPGYFNFKKEPPLSLFPHTVEGSLVDINDDQFADQFGHKYRVVNVSNGHQMLYFGGSSFGFNAVPDYADPASPDYVPGLKAILYYTDFYGYNTMNLPAAWTYKNLLLTSIHSEADNCTQVRGDAESADCTPEGTLPESAILRNRAWLVTHINAVAGTSFKFKDTPAPNMSTAMPHTAFPTPACASPHQLFCDSFDPAEGEVAHGLYQWQRNQTKYNSPQPWNTTFVEAWPGCGRPCNTGPRPANQVIQYGSAHEGGGYAVCVPRMRGSTDPDEATITTHPIAVGAGGATLTYYVRGCTNCTDPPDLASTPQVRRGEDEAACQAAMAKACPGLAHKGPSCHDCCVAHEGVLRVAGCKFVGDPPPDVLEYCRGGGPGPGPPQPKHPMGDFRVSLGTMAANGTETWTVLRSGALRGGPAAAWAHESWAVPAEGDYRVRFSCAGATQDGSNYCALDTVSVTAGKAI